MMHHRQMCIHGWRLTRAGLQEDHCIPSSGDPLLKDHSHMQGFIRPFPLKLYWCLF